MMPTYILNKKYIKKQMTIPRSQTNIPLPCFLPSAGAPLPPPVLCQWEAPVLRAPEPRSGGHGHVWRPHRAGQLGRTAHHTGDIQVSRRCRHMIDFFFSSNITQKA